MGRSSTRAVLLGSGPVLIGIAFSVASFHSNVLAWVCFSIGTLAILFVALPFISRLRIIKKPSSAGERLVHITTGFRRDLYTGAIKYLQAAPHTELLIYAPTGAWHPEPEKKNWMKAVADALINGLSEEDRAKIRFAQKRKVEETLPLECFKAVFGLPPLPAHPTDEELSEFSSLLAEMEDLLAPLNDVESAQVRYLRTEGYVRHHTQAASDNPAAQGEVAAITPGIGVIIFDRPISVFALAVDNRPQMGYAATINDPEVNSQLWQWFYNNLYPALEHNVLQDTQRHVTLSQGFAKLRAEYGIIS